ncbi:MAG: hypothetical protein WCZ98_06180, partial [Sideroxydans sp.]
GFALHAISQIFRETYSAAKTVGGAHERVQQKFRDLCNGTKTRPKDFISSEAIIHVISDSRKTIEKKSQLGGDSYQIGMIER